MKRLIVVLLCIVILVSLAACGGAASSGSEEAAAVTPRGAPPDTAPAEADDPEGSGEAVPVPEAEESKPAGSEDDAVDDPSWAELESLGKIETENGVFYVTVTVPANLMGDGVTQESIDAKAGKTYTSAKLNDDGSVTYKMTKKQHKEMLDSLSENFEQSLQDLVDDDNYSFTKIDHNDDFTSFDVSVSSEELGLMDSFSVLIFYTYGGMYSIFTGRDAENITVNFYGASGTLINTANSSDMGD